MGRLCGHDAATPRPLVAGRRQVNKALDDQSLKKRYDIAGLQSEIELGPNGTGDLLNDALAFGEAPDLVGDD